ncbi:hypothetical protein NXS19_008745 [Fusarium pseudograminearum]|nr:hypothetical protein NXS19_008745 [Fusarium pseudograminearum]
MDPVSEREQLYTLQFHKPYWKRGGCSHKVIRLIDCLSSPLLDQATSHQPSSSPSKPDHGLFFSIAAAIEHDGRSKFLSFRGFTLLIHVLSQK